MRLLWHSNGMASPTGYGNQTGLFVPLVKERQGWDVAISAFYGRQAQPAISFGGVQEYPGYGDPYGNGIIRGHVAHWQADTVVSLIDPFVLDPMIWGSLNWAAWVPIDCEPMSRNNFNVVQHARRVWAMSRFGERMMRDAGLDKIDYVPHGVDTEVFKPIDRGEARADLGKRIGAELDGKFLVVTVAANKGHPSRKNFAGMMRAFAAFHRAYPESAWYIHTDPHTGDGENLHLLAEMHGVADAVYFPEKYYYVMNLITPEFLNKIYNAGDVMMLLSHGEGFGIPIVEAQAAGCPVVVTDGSAMSELVFSGYTVMGQKVPAWGARDGGFWVQADCAEAVYKLKCVQMAYEHGKPIREAARDGALEYDYKRVFEKWMVPALSKLTPPPNPLPVYGEGGQARRETGESARRDVCVGDVALVVHENASGGTARDAAVEAISDYGLDKIDLKPGEVVVDVGANVGVMSLYLAKKFPEAQIIAVEPHPQTFEYLKLNIKANGCENITALNYAVNADGGFVRLGGDVDENAGGVHMFGDGEEVTAVPLAHVFAHHAEGKRVALLKLDCEGAEWGVLRSSLDVLDEVDRIRGELHVNQQLPYDMTLIDRVVGLVPDTVWTDRIIADFTPQTPPLAPPRRQGGESARQEQVGQAGLDKERYPVVTVLIPTLNGADTITKAIESVLTPPLAPPRRQGGESARQEQGEQVERVGHPLVEVVVVDDGSTDETVHIVRSLREKYANLVLVEMGENVGQVAAMNAGLRAARGEWVLFIGDDDVVDADGLREMIDQLQAWDNTIGFVYSDYQYMGKRTDRVNTPPFRRADYHRHFAAGAACMWRRAIGLEYRTLHDGKHAHGEDFDLIYRLVEMGYAGKKLPTVKPVVHLNLVDGRGTSWLHQHQDEGALAEFKRRHPQFRGRL